MNIKPSLVVIGEKYNNWTVLKRIPRTESGPKRTAFLCKCDCGKEAWVDSGNLIRGKTKSCGCLLGGRDWLPEEEEILRKYYFRETTEKLCRLLPKRTYDGIKIHARKLKLNRDDQKRSGDISKLLLETPEAYYWAGFIAADGHIDKNNRIVVTLAIKDSEHLKKLGDFLQTNNYRENLTKRHPHCNISVQDRNFGERFAKKFNFNSRKTYEPPNLDSIVGNFFIAFLCGFIDGDGCIKNQTGRRDSIIYLKGHSSWIKNYSFFEKQLYKESKLETFRQKDLTHLNARGYAVLAFSDRRILNFLKKKALDMELPLLSRKWDRIDLLLPESRYESAKRIKIKIKEMFNNNISQRDIAKELNISSGYVSLILSGRR